ncbi:hypothetical protein [Streptococcus sanguinis]|uniref:hypothetical protein n=1 Tax=Streptococcus sanguinis TaxID=1305 RepID=UPI0007799D70|nr:hypothetical protein [Streptococcus sanguinis]
MFWWRKKWLDELSDSDESPFLECRHLLFEGESDYPICPSCGKLIKENLPQNSVDRSRLFLIYQKVKRVWSVKIGITSTLLIIILSYWLPQVIGDWFLWTGDYGFSRFIPSSSHNPTLFSVTLFGYIPLFILFVARERVKRFFTFSLRIEHFHKILYSWPVRLVTFIAVICFINIIMPKIYGVEGDVFIGKHSQLTPAQHAKGVELFIFVNMLSIWIVSGLLLIYQLIDRRRTWWLKEANEVYLSGGC